MYLKKYLNIVFAVSFFLLGTSVFAQTTDVITNEHGMKYLPGQLIVKFRDNKINLEKPRGMQLLSQLETTKDFETQDTLTKENIALITVDENQTIESQIARLSQDPNVEYVQPNFMYELLSQPDDPYFAYQRALDNIGQNVDGNIGTSGADIHRVETLDIRSGDKNPNTTGTTIAILDVGFDYTHADLINQVWDGTDCLTPAGTYRGGCSGGGYDAHINSQTGIVGYHGTYVAGIPGAETNNGFGVAGINPGAKLMNINVFNGSNIDDYAAIAALSFAKYNGAKVVNMSRGSRCSNCSYNIDEALYNAMRDFPGLIAVAAGNRSWEHTGTNYVTPADFASNTPAWTGLPNVISVGGTDQRDNIAVWASGTSAPGSDYGTRISIGAPTCIYTTSINYPNALDRACGTSLAAPNVAGAISLLRSMKPELSYLQIKNAILENADSLPSLSGKFYNGRRLNVFAAMQYLYVQQISGLTMFTDATRQQAIHSGSYLNKASGYIERGLSSISGQVSDYLVDIYYSGMLLESTTTTDTGIVLSLSGDGWYQTFVTPIYADKQLTGNTQTTYFALDTLDPIVEVLYTPVSGSRTSGNVIATLSGNETLTGMNATGHTFTGNGIFTFTFSDLAGNTGSVTATVDRIDKQLPIFTGVVDEGVYTGVAITFSDNTSGAIATLNGSGYTGNTLITGNGTYILIIRDLAGNSTGATFIIDNTPPTSPILTPVSPLRNGQLSRSTSTDTGVGMTGGYYTYDIYLSGGGGGRMGMVMSTGITLDIRNNGEYIILLSSCDVLDNCHVATTGSFIVNKPLPFSFTSQTNKELSTGYFSDESTLTGLFTGATIVIQSGSYSINAGALSSTTGIVYNGDSIKIYLTSSSAYSSTTSATLNVGGLTGTFSITTKSTPVSPGGGGGGGGGGTSTCLLTQLICSGSVYIRTGSVTCEGGSLGMSCTMTGIVIQTGINSGGGQSQISSLFSAELNQAYSYAREIGITTMPSIEKANLTGTLIRQHLAKMMSNFAINVLDKKPNTGMNCIFQDMQNSTIEMKFYAKLSCQLGLMGLVSDDISNTHFFPEVEVTRAQFGTVLSRALRGDIYNNIDTTHYFTEHLRALNKIGIMKNISDPLMLEIRGYVMLMIMRINTSQ